MVTLTDINKATFDGTSSEDFTKLLQQFAKDNPVSDESKKLFRDTVAKLQQDKV